MRDGVVDLRETEPGILQLTMQDRVNKNTFSQELMQGLVEAFAEIDSNQHCKAVVLTGYDNYFAAGGTKDGLIALHENKFKISDTNVYRLPLDCQVPVIAAMQGHAIGGGFVMGLFSDFVVMSRESIYTTNFMKYGFTPGMGATYILPKKLGLSLTEELLFTAANYRGAELLQRGVPFPVLPRAEVLQHAYGLARQLAEKPRFSLVTLKDHLMAHIREQLPAIIEQEVVMHDKTFHQPEVKDRIVQLFGS